MKCDASMSDSLREFEVRVAARQGPKDLRCDGEVGSTSDSRSGSSER